MHDKITPQQAPPTTLEDLQLELANCKRQQREYEFELSLLKDVSSAIIRELDPDQMLQLVAEKAQEIIAAEAVMIPMINESRDRYRYIAAAGANAKDILGTDFAIQVGMCGWVLSHEQRLIFGADTPFAMNEITQWEQGQVSALLVPLQGRKQIIGGLSALGKQGGGSFTARDLDLMTLFANQVSIAIENAMLFNSTKADVLSLEHRVAERTAQLSTLNLELESFCYSASHDLRTPLRAIDGFSQLLLEEYRTIFDDTARDYLSRIRNNSQRLGETIDEILRLSKITRHELHWEAIDLSTLANKFSQKLNRLSPERKVDWHIAPGLHCQGDLKLVRAALEQLLENAWKYSRNQHQAEIHFSGDCGHRETVFCLTDNGVGFDMKYKNMLFKPFQKLHDRHHFEGSGIGLAIAYRILQRHGGRLWAESTPGKGACFYFTLPANAPGAS